MSNPELLKAEESVKEKHIELVKALSFLELKRFNKAEYAGLVLSDMVKLLPEFDKTQLKETAHYVSNALNNEAQHQLKLKSRASTTMRDNHPKLLSSTVLEDLELTMRTDCGEDINHTLSDYNESIGNGDDSDLSTSTVESTIQLDDSQTNLKQAVNTENGTSDTPEKSAKGSKCCNSCKIKAKSKKKYAMIRCSLCMTWYHEQCVEIDKNEPVGLWLCLSCRNVPQELRTEISCLKKDVDQLKQSTCSILSAVGELSTKLENCIGGINDRITALNKQINLHDMNITETIDNLSSTASNMKNNFDKKSTQILNKTSAVFEKVKLHANSLTTNACVGADATVSQTSKSTTCTTNNKLKVTTVRQRPVKPSKNKPHPSSRIGKPHLQTQRKQQKQVQQVQNKQHSPQMNNANRSQVIDLTQTYKPKKFIKQSTLLIGSSILKNVKTNQLHENTAVRTFPGATISTIKAKLSDLNIEKCETLIIHVGGNDADNGIELDTFYEEFDSLIDSVSDGTRRVIISGLLPRDTVDLEPYNEILQSLCADNAVEFVDNYNGFLLASGEIADIYFHKDKVHINTEGTGRLLRNIDKLHRVTRQYATLEQNNSSQGYRQGFRRNAKGFPSRGYQPSPNYRSSYRYCHICSRNGGHSTQECWFNGRNNGSAGYASR